jgi:topoisomerase IV subunit B
MGLVERLMGRDPSKRFEFIQARASALDEEEIDA